MNMLKIIFLVIFIILILFVLGKNSSNKKNIYNKLIFLVLFLGLIFILITSGRFVLPQLIQILKIGLPFLTKFVGI